MNVKAGLKKVGDGVGRLRQALLATSGDLVVKVGYLGNEEAENGLTTAQLGAIHTYGTTDGRIPARPHIQPALDEHKQEYIDFLKDICGRILDGRMTAEQGLNLLGAKAAADVKDFITGGDPVPPPNAPSTIARKGSDRTLVDTGRLVNSITWAVSKRESE